MFIAKDKFGKDKWKTLYTEYMPTITAQVDIVTRNIKKIVKSKALVRPQR